jgi:bacteriocin-like protein
MTMIELTEEELQAVAGGQNHGQATSEAVHWAQDYVRTNGGQMGTQVSFTQAVGLACRPAASRHCTYSV